MKVLRLCFFTFLVVGIASAATSYKVTIAADTTAAGVPLKAGTYKVEIAGNQATFTQGKQTTQVPASVEQSPKKFQDTTLEMSQAGLSAIDVGGTTTKIVFTAKK